MNGAPMKKLTQTAVFALRATNAGCVSFFIPRLHALLIIRLCPAIRDAVRT